MEKFFSFVFKSCITLYITLEYKNSIREECKMKNMGEGTHVTKKMER